MTAAAPAASKRSSHHGLSSRRRPVFCLLVLVVWLGGAVYMICMWWTANHIQRTTTGILQMLSVPPPKPVRITGSLPSSSLPSLPSLAVVDDADTVYAWMHIPKTAGTHAYATFMMPLFLDRHRSIYPPPAAPMPLGRWSSWNTPGCSLNNNPIYGATHCSANEIHDCLVQNRDRFFSQSTTKSTDDPRYSSPLQVKFLTAIRHPVERVISEYFFFRRNPHAIAWTKSMKDNSGTLKDWVLDPQNVAHNRQALFFMVDEPFPLPSKLDPDDNEPIPHCTSFAGPKAMEWIERRYGSIDGFNNAASSPDGMEAMTTSFFGRLVEERFAFVGIVEDMNMTELLYLDKFFPDPEKSLKGNNMTKEQRLSPTPKQKKVLPTSFVAHDTHGSRKDKSMITDEVRRLIESKNRLDMMLYEVAKRRLYEHYQ